MTILNRLANLKKILEREFMEMIDIDSIKIDNPYLRLETDIDQLIKSIETVGLINPLVINEKNELIAGGRRYCALKKMGRTQVPVSRVEKSEMEQELISIDENLVRQDLNKVEMEAMLKRGRDIYENLFPKAMKTDEEDLSTPAGNELQQDLPNDQRSFIDITAEKTGLSKKVIKSAIDREEKSSDTVKKLRNYGELNASQTNQIIRLKKDEQEKAAEYLKDKSAKEVREFVEKAKSKSVEEALLEAKLNPPLPKEYQSLKTLIKRTNKVLAKLLLEDVAANSEEVSEILDQIGTLRISLDQFLEMCSKRDSYQNLADEAVEMLNNEDSEPAESEW